MKKIIPIIVVIVICAVLLFAGGLISFKKNNINNNTTNTTNMTNINLTNNTTANVEINNNHNSSEAKSGSYGAPSDIYSRWDTDGDGIISSSESDVHDRSLGQGNYYTGHENMKDSVSTYPQ